MESKRKQAEKLYEKYSVILHGLTDKASRGDNKAAVQVMSKMTERNLEIIKLGFHVGFHRKNIVTNKTHKKHVQDFKERSKHLFQK